MAKALLQESAFRSPMATSMMGLAIATALTLRVVQGSPGAEEKARGW